MTRTRILGALFLVPALVFVVLFYLLPVVLTGVFAFTNMSTATGIGAGEWRLTPSTLRGLEGGTLAPDAVARLRRDAYVIDAAGLYRARAAGVDADFLEELAERHGGATFAGRRAFERAVRELDERPRSFRELRGAVAHFERSVVNRTFQSRAAFLAAVAELGVALDPRARDTLADAAYTGWRWTADNFRRMVQSPENARVLANTLVYVFATLVLFNTGFALVLAVTTFYLPPLPASVFRTIWFLPRLSPPVLYVLLWKWLAWDTGMLNALLSPLGVDARNWMLDTPLNAWVFVVLINGFVGASMGMILFASAIRAIPRPLFWAARVDGASRGQEIRRIILPQLRWPILFVTSYQTLSLITSFEYILLATDGGPGSATEVWALRAYHVALNNYAGNLEYGYGAALALVLVTLGLGLSLVYLRLFGFARLTARPRIEV